MRDDEYLYERLRYLQDNHFADIDVCNEVVIRFGRAARTRLGSIVLRSKARPHAPLPVRLADTLSHDEVVSIITINGIFRDHAHPEEVIDAVIVHEYCHYAHGFSSMHPKRFAHPHAGGIIEKEFEARNLWHLHLYQKKWLKDHWWRVIDEAVPPRPQRPRVKKRSRRRRRSSFLRSFGL